MYKLKLYCVFSLSLPSICFLSNSDLSHDTSHHSHTVPDQNLIEQKSCEDSWYGCCPDGKTQAQGPNHAGCPSLCGCNKLGSYSEVCDPETNQCRCRPGVGGAKCDRCEPGYWGLPKISSGYRGCIRKKYLLSPILQYGQKEKKEMT